MAETLKLITQTESWLAEVNDDVVMRVRELLSKAEAGEITGIAYSAACADGCVLTCATKSTNQSAIIGGLERVKHNMLVSEK